MQPEMKAHYSASLCMAGIQEKSGDIVTTYCREKGSAGEKRYQQ